MGDGAEGIAPEDSARVIERVLRGELTPFQGWMQLVPASMFTLADVDEQGNEVPAVVDVEGARVIVGFSPLHAERVVDSTWDGQPLLLHDVGDLHTWWPPDVDLWLDPGVDGGGLRVGSDGVAIYSEAAAIVGACAAYADAGAGPAQLATTAASAFGWIEPLVDQVWFAVHPLGERRGVACLDVSVDPASPGSVADSTAADVGERFNTLLRLATGYDVVTAVRVEGVERWSQLPAGWEADVADGLELCFTDALVELPPENALERLLNTPVTTPGALALAALAATVLIPYAGATQDRGLQVPVSPTDEGDTTVAYTSELALATALFDGAPYRAVCIADEVGWPDGLGVLLNPGLASSRRILGPDLAAARASTIA